MGTYPLAIALEKVTDHHMIGVGFRKFVTGGLWYFWGNAEQSDKWLKTHPNLDDQEKMTHLYFHTRLSMLLRRAIGKSDKRRAIGKSDKRHSFGNYMETYIKAVAKAGMSFERRVEYDVSKETGCQPPPDLRARGSAMFVPPPEALLAQKDAPPAPPSLEHWADTYLGHYRIKFQDWKRIAKEMPDEFKDQFEKFPARNRNKETFLKCFSDKSADYQDHLRNAIVALGILPHKPKRRRLTSAEV